MRICLALAISVAGTYCAVFGSKHGAFFAKRLVVGVPRPPIDDWTHASPLIAVEIASRTLGSAVGCPGAGFIHNGFVYRDVRMVFPSDALATRRWMSMPCTRAMSNP